jgi:hypothetical protein
MEWIQQSNRNIFLKGMPMKMLTELFDSGRRSRLVVIGLIIVILFSVTVCWLTMRAGSVLLPSAKNQRHLGKQIAKQIGEVLPRGQVVILALFRRGLEPYGSCIEALKSSLDPDLQVISEVYPIDEGTYNDDDYTASIDVALARHPEAELLCVISAGSVSHAAISPRLTSFLETGRKLVLVGHIIHRDSPFVYLAGAGHATIIARRTGWLKTVPRQIAPNSDSTKNYFQRDYVILPY